MIFIPLSCANGRHLVVQCWSNENRNARQFVHGICFVACADNVKDFYDVRKMCDIDTSTTSIVIVVFGLVLFNSVSPPFYFSAVVHFSPVCSLLYLCMHRLCFTKAMFPSALLCLVLISSDLLCETVIYSALCSLFSVWNALLCPALLQIGHCSAPAWLYALVCFVLFNSIFNSPRVEWHNSVERWHRYPCSHCIVLLVLSANRSWYPWPTLHACIDGSSGRGCALTQFYPCPNNTKWWCSHFGYQILQVFLCRLIHIQSWIIQLVVHL